MLFFNNFFANKYFKDYVFSLNDDDRIIAFIYETMQVNLQEACKSYHKAYKKEVLNTLQYRKGRMKPDKMDTLLVSLPVLNFGDYDDMVFLVFEENASSLLGYFTFEFWEEANDKIYYRVMQWKNESWIDLGNMSLNPNEHILQDDLLTFLKVSLAIQEVNKRTVQNGAKSKPKYESSFDKERKERIQGFDAMLAKWSRNIGIHVKEN